MTRLIKLLILIGILGIVASFFVGPGNKPETVPPLAVLPSFSPTYIQDVYAIDRRGNNTYKATYYITKENALGGTAVIDIIKPTDVDVNQFRQQVFRFSWKTLSERDILQHEVELKWQDSKTLEITYDPSIRPKIQQHAWGDVTIFYDSPRAPYGHYFEPHGAVHWLELYPDKTFEHNRLDQTTYDMRLESGTYTLIGENLTLHYDAINIPSLKLRLYQDKAPFQYNWYITGKDSKFSYYFVRQQASVY